MRKVFAGFAALLPLAVVVQFYFAAVGAFDTAPMDDAFAVHRMLGYLILLLALLMTVVAAIARAPGKVIGLTGLIAGLVLLQSLIAVVSGALGDTSDTTTTAGRLVFGLHAVNALAIMALAGTVARQARSLASTTSGTSQASGTSEASGSHTGAAPETPTSPAT